MIKLLPRLGVFTDILKRITCGYGKIAMVYEVIYQMLQNILCTDCFHMFHWNIKENSFVDHLLKGLKTNSNQK